MLYISVRQTVELNLGNYEKMDILDEIHSTEGITKTTIYKGILISHVFYTSKGN